MLKMSRRGVMFSILMLLAGSAVAQTEIASIPFESVPGNTSFVTGGAGGSPIEMQADTNVTGDLSTTGEVATDTGVRFPDGSFQVTAGAAGAGVTANAGLYSNTIADFTPPLAFSEVCFKAGGTQLDIHAASEPTAGGNCVPGDTGWIVERFERASGAQVWSTARVLCLQGGMRLLEPFEWQVSCNMAAQLALDSMTDTWEWASNTAIGLLGSVGGIFGGVMGQGSCAHGSPGTVGNTNGATSSFAFRCAR